MEHRIGGGRDTRQRQDRAEPQPPQRREVESAGRLGEVSERVGARVAVVGGVGRRAGPARVEDDDEGPAAHERRRGRGSVTRSERKRGTNAARSTRANSPAGA